MPQWLKKNAALTPSATAQSARSEYRLSLAASRPT
jgi:hypothetical protein